MRRLRTVNWYAILLCLTCAGGVTLLRIGLVEGLHVWSEDGRLNVSPWVFALVNGGHIGLVLALVFAMIQPVNREAQ